MFKQLANITSMLRNARKMQDKMADMQEGLAKLRVEGTAGGGMVTVEASGQQKILAVRIEESLWDSRDREMVEDLVATAVNSALDKAKEAAAEEMQKLTGDLPGLGDALAKFTGAGDDGLAQEEQTPQTT